MRYLYDGSFKGLMTVAFDTYRKRNNIYSVEVNGKESSFMIDSVFIETDTEKAYRIIDFVKGKVGKPFYHMLQMVFFSTSYDKDTAIINAIHKSCELGTDMTRLFSDELNRLKKYENEVKRELELYLNNMTFEKKEGAISFGIIHPDNDIMILLLDQLRKNPPSSRFAIFDSSRACMAYYENGRFYLYEMPEFKIDYSKGSYQYYFVWKEFYADLQRREAERFQTAGKKKNAFKEIAALSRRVG